MVFRLLCGGLGLFQTANGLMMIVAPKRWFMTAPGAAATGPFNPHFVIDVGLGFLAAGLAFLACAWRSEFKPVALGASGFVLLHALFHLSHLAMGAAAEAPVAIAVAIPAFLGLALAWPGRKVTA